MQGAKHDVLHVSLETVLKVKVLEEEDDEYSLAHVDMKKGYGELHAF